MIFQQLLSFKLFSDQDDKIMADLCIIVNFLTFLCFHYCEAAGRCCVLSFGSSLSRLDRSAPIS